ncbi:MAG: FAD-dependent oxidoreductase [Cyanobium sp.]
MNPSPPAASAITVVGDGLAGTVLALSLAARGAAVQLIGAELQTATSLSYGALPRGGPSWAWRRLERSHGSLGWHPSGLVFHDGRPGLPNRLAALTQRLPLPLARVDAPTWSANRAQALAAAGVRCLQRRVTELKPRPAGGWRLDLAPQAGQPDPAAQAEQGLDAGTLVLAAGAGCRDLWPALPSRLRHSWAGVLLIGAEAPTNPWLQQTRQGRIVQPRYWQRPALEAAAETAEHPRWLVDAGMAPWGDGVVLGQISWIPAAGVASQAASAIVPPDPIWMEEQLRAGLGLLDPALAEIPGTYRQAPVSFCSDGAPLVGPVAGAPGLWVFAGFSAAFSRVPTEAEALASLLMVR